ncbi:MAG: undecaprenyl-phosphate glucose phosphotransferase [Candidatus Aminicenantes bacterium]|nr:undecaprenyl-phosphate glucose phosphotransferase [Candidatus Aminicenantes bacterium]
MIREKGTHLIGFYILSDFVGISLAYFCSYFFRFKTFIPVNPERGTPAIKSYIIIFPLFLCLHLLIFFIQGFYRTRLKRVKIDDLFFVTINVFITLLIIQAVLSYFSSYSQGVAPLFRMTFKISHGFLVIYAVYVILFVLFFRFQIYFFMKRRFARGMNLQNILVVGAGEMGKAVTQKLLQLKDLGFEVKGILDDNLDVGRVINSEGGIKVLGPIKELEPILEREQISDVYVALDLNNYSQILETLKVVNKYAVNVRLVPDLFQLLTLKAKLEDLDGFPVISIDEPPLRGIMLFLKRGMDVCASAVLLILLAPFFFLMGILVKLTSKGPVFYHQERMEMDGKKFVMHKFRTMVYDAEVQSGPVMCAPEDPRITKIGRFLRRFSIDEFPQLFNVLRGEMSLVGPRPERPVFVEEFREKIPKYMLRHKVKSGVTGWAQVHGLRQGTPIAKRLEYDFYYIQNWSFALDLKILWKTLRKGFIDKSF